MGKDNTLVPLSLLEEWKKVKASVSTYIFKNSKAMPHEEEALTFNQICETFLLK